MLILSIHFGHDASVVVAEDYQILAAVQMERISRQKGDGRFENLLTTINEALRIAGKTSNQIKVLATSRTNFAADYHLFSLFSARAKHAFYRIIGKKTEPRLWTRYRESGIIDYRPVFNAEKFIAALGLPAKTQFFDYGHHNAHALSALFFTDWENALLYTADGGGDWLYYSASHLCEGKLHTIYGGDQELHAQPPIHSIGLAYGYMTRALGYKMNRHEGKLTGLAAYGKPALYNALSKHFTVDDNGYIHSDFSTHKQMEQTITTLAKTVTPEDAAASIQKLLEDVVLNSISQYLKRTGATKIGLAGGVFANVALNRRIAELPQVEEIFIFPGMGDEGIPIGGVYEFLLQRDGIEKWLSQRRLLDNVYWGGEYDDEVETIFNASDIEKISGNTAENAARLLQEGAIVALYCNRMEFGPRALGARSILASPINKDVNDTLNQRLTRTEFMPFAPYVLEEDADSVFEITDCTRYAMRFMTITCTVREQWRDKIPAVVHVDGTARPQIIRDADNPLYADILRQFKQKTGLPVLVNTSFNAHEEPIINTPAECLRALRDKRVDYVATTAGLYRIKKQ